MARRKRAYLEDDLDSSDASQDDNDEPTFDDNDPDERAARALFEDPYQRRKRRRPDDDDDDDEGFGGRRRKQEKRLHFTQAPAFVSGETRKMDVSEAQEQDSDEDEDEDEDEEASEDEPPAASPPPEPRVREEPEEDRPRMGIGRRGGIGARAGLGASATPKDATTPQFAPRGGIGSGKPGLGAGMGSSKPRAGLGASSAPQDTEDPPAPSRGGIGSSKPGLGVGIGASNPALAASSSLPSTFGSPPPPPQQRAFIREGSGSGSGPGTPKLTAEEQRHFSKLQGSFGARLMAKMGWQAGTGLGATGTGIVTPVETKLRPKASMGLAFKGFKEKTAQSKAEAKRRGETVSSDDDDGAPSKKSRAAKTKPKTDAWKKPKRAKVKVEHQTYEQIVQNAADSGVGTGQDKIYDATSGEMREVASLAALSSASASWTPTADAHATRIPEVRHNIRLIADAATRDLDGLAREARALEERKRWVRREEARVGGVVRGEAELIERLQAVHLVVDALVATSQAQAQSDSLDLNTFTPHVEKLTAEYAAEYERYGVDEVVVAAVAPVVRQLLADWTPLADPTCGGLVDVLTRWRGALRFSTPADEEEEKPAFQMDVYGARSKPPPTQDLTMTPYESLLWNAWLPKVRSCINNDWHPTTPHPAVALYTTWALLLPRFMRENVRDQLVLPKVLKAVAEWEPRAGGAGTALQALVFPWLPHLGARADEVLGEAKRKVKALLRAWRAEEGVPADLDAWRDVFGLRDWDALLLKSVVPKLGALLRGSFTVNPRQQEMQPLLAVLGWAPLLPPAVLSQLLEAEFVPKWLDVLHVWLCTPGASYDEVARWYAFWRDVFPAGVRELEGVKAGFTRGLQMMNQAIELGPEAAAKLPRPDHSAPAPNTKTQTKTKKTPAPARAAEITFRTIVEDFAAQHDLLFVPAGRVHAASRMPLFRVARGVDGRGGVLVYVLDDAVWAGEGEGEWGPIGLEEMVVRANKGGGR